MTGSRADVVVVGGGPVGLALALALAERDVDVIVVESRIAGAPPSVRCNHVSARTMEIFRRLGLADDIRAAGLPADFPNDVAYVTTMTGEELSRTVIPGAAGRRAGATGADTDWPTPEPAHRINQIYLEPVLARHAKAHPRIRVLDRTTAEGIEHLDHEVRVAVRADGAEATREIVGAYLVGCDGGPSLTRRTIGATLSGDPEVGRYQSTYLRAPDLLGRLPGDPAWMTMAFNGRCSGVIIAIDGRETWLLHRPIPDSGQQAELTADEAIRIILGVGADFSYEVIGREEWTGRRLVADRFRDGRVFLCGDSAHLWVPFAGYGMNAGIADAENLAWLLAAHLDGWAPASILAAYERERRPITDQVSHFAMDHCLAYLSQRSELPPQLEAVGPEGEQTRAAFGEAVERFDRQQFAAGGLNFGYFYADSPIIASDGEAPAYSMGEFVQSTVPGQRTPHVWLVDGRSLYDAMGPWYTLLRFDTRVEVDGIAAAARARGVPLEVLDVTGEHSEYDRKLVLSRPDRHVAWRGDALPNDPGALVEVIRGAAAARAAVT